MPLVLTLLQYYLHSFEPPVLHRDIKAGNVMVNKVYGAKLGDFGESRSLAVDRTMTVVGTLYW